MRAFFRSNLSYKIQINYCGCCWCSTCWKLWMKKRDAYIMFEFCPVTNTNQLASPCHLSFASIHTANPLNNSLDSQQNHPSHLLLASIYTANSLKNSLNAQHNWLVSRVFLLVILSAHISLTFSYFGFIPRFIFYASYALRVFILQSRAQFVLVLNRWK